MIAKSFRAPRKGLCPLLLSLYNVAFSIITTAPVRSLIITVGDRKLCNWSKMFTEVMKMSKGKLNKHFKCSIHGNNNIGHVVVGHES